MTSRRCQRPVTRSFHGLGVLSKVRASSVPVRRCHAGEPSSLGPKPVLQVPVVISRGSKPPRCLTKRNPSICSPCHPVAEATLRSGDLRGRSRVSLHRLFSEGREPQTAPQPSRTTEAVSEDWSSASGVCPEVAIVTSWSTMPLASRHPPEGGRLSTSSPVGHVTDLHEVF